MRVTSTDDTALIPAIPPPRTPTDPRSGAEEAAPPDEADLPAPPEPLEARWLTVASWLAPMLATAGLGLIGLTGSGLGEDELATWGLVSAPWPDFWQVLRNTDASIGPYYVLLRGWVELAGTSDTALRLPSVLFAAGAAGLVAAAGTRIGGRRVGFVAGLLFAAVPTVSRYGQEARPYALTAFAATLATYLLLRLLDRPRFLRYAAYSAAVGLLGLAHAVALLIVPAHAYVVWRQRRSGRTVAGWLTAVAVGVLPVLPVLYVGSRQTETQVGWIPPLSGARLAETPAALFGGAAMAGALIALALAALSLREPARVATTWALGPVLGLLGASLVVPLWVPRYLLFVLPAWVLLAAFALRQLTILRGLVAVLVIGLLGVTVQLQVRQPGGHGLASRDVDAVLRANAEPGDAVVFGPFAAGDQRTARDIMLRYVPSERRPNDVLMRDPPRTGGRLGAQECLDRDLPICFGRQERVWVIRKGTMEDPLDEIGPAKEQLLKEGYVVSRDWRLTGLVMALLIRKPAI
jgi:mannosyltransferase